MTTSSTTEQKEPQQQPKKPVVRPFATMRLTHEAIRVGIKAVQRVADSLVANPNNNQNSTDTEETSDPNNNDVDDSAADSDFLIDFQGTFDNVSRLIKYHSEQENAVFFPLLDTQFESVCVNEKFVGEHTKDVEYRQRITDAYAQSDFKALQLAVTEFAESHEKHLKHEETVMMPLTRKTADTVEGRGAIVRRIINYDRSEFNEFQFAYVLKLLVDSRPFGKVLMYCKAVQMSSSAEEYAVIRSKIENIVGAEVYAKLVANGVNRTANKALEYNMHIIYPSRLARRRKKK